MTTAVLKPLLPSSYPLHHGIYFGVASLSFVIVYCMIQCCNHVLMTKPQIFNPFKLIAQVLNYARKHKFPERRSAFTYWEEECPSRLDLGKDKYGGPFTFEEVENVKTVLNLFPLISCILPTIAYYGEATYDTSPILKHNTDLRLWISISWSVLVTCFLPAYQFFIYPIFYSYIPGMLRRIGGGMFLVLFTQAINLVVDMFVEGHSTNNESEPVTISCLTLVAHLIRLVGLYLALVTTVEFTIAQSPCQIRGIASFLLVELYGIFSFLEGSLYHLIPEHRIAHAVIFATLSGFFMLFLFLSKRYKLRQRDEPIPYHMFAENQFESNHKQERDYLKEHGWLT